MTTTAEKGKTLTACCQWGFWQEPVTNAEGQYTDLSGKVIKKPIMRWVEVGTPCKPCFAKAQAELDDTCADGRCSKGFFCEQHGTQYDTPQEWPTTKAEYEATFGQHRNVQVEGERKVVSAYHRNPLTALTALAKLTQPAPKGRSVKESLTAVKAAVDRVYTPEGIDAMARRCLTEQQSQGRHWPLYGQGLYGDTIILDSNAALYLARLDGEAPEVAQDEPHEDEPQAATLVEEEDDYPEPAYQADPDEGRSALECALEADSEEEEADDDADAYEAPAAQDDADDAAARWLAQHEG